MKTNLVSLASALLLSSLALLSSANAVPLTMSTPGLVGVYDGKLVNASIATEIVAAQKLLDMTFNTTFGGDADSDGIFLYQTSTTTEYSGTLVGGLKSDLTASGWEYGFAKYDGKNAGYVLFYLGGALASTIVPQYPDNFWTTKGQYAISHLTVFNKSGDDIPGVADGGSTVVLVGLALAGLSFVARRRRVA